MRQVNIDEAKTHFSKLIKEVLNGDEIIIAKGNKPVAKLISIEQTKLKRTLGTAKGKIKITPDFDLPLNDFKNCIKWNMKYLIDTHTFLWIIEDNKNLTDKVRTIYIDNSNDIYLSVASIWEMAI